MASCISRSRTKRDAQILMRRGQKRAGDIPRFILTDKLKSYSGAIEDTCGADSFHVQAGPFGEGGCNTRDIERFHGTLKDRTKVLRPLANGESAELAMTGWLIHYNLFRPHSGIGDRAPADATGAKSEVRSWRDVVEA